MFRHQLPVYSPLTPRALWRGWAAVARGSDGGAGEAVRAALMRRYGAEDVVLTDSGTTALTLALSAAGRAQPPAPVALPAYSCYDLATAADGASAEVLCYDVDPTTLSPDLASLEGALRQGAGTIVLAHLYGIPAHVAGARQLAQTYGAVLVDDAAQGGGAEVGGISVGGFGTFGVVSFGRGKGATGGGGGALLGRGEAGRIGVEWARSQLASGGRGFGNMVRLTAQWVLGRPALFGLPASLPFLGVGETTYRRAAPGRGAAAACPAALRVNDRLLAEEVAVRRRHAARIAAMLPAGVGCGISPAEDAEPGYLRFPYLVSGLAGAVARSSRAARLGVMPGYPKPLVDLPPGGRRMINREAGFPGARRLAADLVTLPTHGKLVESDFQRLGQWLDHLR